MPETRVKVLYIGGYSRSGSTLLLRLLGQLEGFVGVGEVWDIWRRSFIENQLCGCGRPFSACEFWQAVIDAAYGGFAQVDVDAMQALRRSVQSNRHIPLLALPSLRTAGYQKNLDIYTGALGKLYRGLHEVSGGKIIVDSSKVPPYAFLLGQVAGVDLNIVHLVRDSRATAYSWQRKKARPEIHWKKAYMDQYSPVRSALEWNVMNWLLHVQKDNCASYTRIRYEELVHEPRQAIVRIATNLGDIHPDTQYFENGHTVRLGVDHTLSGNPNRFQQGEVKIRIDDEWQEKMTPGEKRLVTVLTWPLLRKYGYLSRDGAHGRNGVVKEAKLWSAHQPATRKSPLRILLVTARYPPYIGGTEIHTYEVARRLAAAENEVTVLTTSTDQREITCERTEGVQIVRVPAWPRDRDYYFAPDLYRFITRGGWDILHCQGYHTLVAPTAMMAARQADLPYVVSFHSGGNSSRLRVALRPLQHSLLRPLFARAAALVGVSRWEAEFFRKRLRLPAERFTVIPNGSYLPVVENVPYKRNDGTLIVSVGRLEHYKGHHRVITALPLVAQAHPGVHLRIVGHGPYEAALYKLVRDYGVADRVEIQAVSAHDRAGMASVLMGASLVILLSSYESQGISVMEALALGRPVLVADSTALRELAASGLARATPLGSTPKEVAAAILEQLRRPLIPAQSELPTWDDCARDLQALYHRSLQQRS